METRERATDTSIKPVGCSNDEEYVEKVMYALQAQAIADGTGTTYEKVCVDCLIV